MERLDMLLIFTKYLHDACGTNNSCQFRLEPVVQKSYIMNYGEIRMR